MGILDSIYQKWVAIVLTLATRDEKLMCAVKNMSICCI